jgi:serine protease inhibitor
MVSDFHNKSITNLTKVSMTMANHLFSKQEYQQNNIVFSPLSLYTVLSVIAAGSEGPTQQQLLSFLLSKSIDQLKSLSSQLVSFVLAGANAPSGGPLLSFVNGMWVEQSLSLQPSFKEIVATDFKTTLASVDFMTVIHLLFLILNPCLLLLFYLVVLTNGFIYLHKRLLFFIYLIMDLLILYLVLF